MTRVWDDTKFKGTELLVLLCLADHANDEGVCWPSYAKLATRARVSPRRVMQCVKVLIAEGWLEREERGNIGKSNVYRLILPDEGVKPASPLKPASLGGETGCTPGVKQISSRGVKQASHEPSVESSVNRKEPPSALVPIDSDDHPFQHFEQ